MPAHEGSGSGTADSNTDSIRFVAADAPQHISHIIMLAHRIWPVSYANILTPQQIDNMLLLIYSRENLLKEMESGHQFWLAYEAHKPIAYASAYKEGHVIWLKKIYVEPDIQGKRVGVRLLHKTITPHLPAKEIRLLANPKNTPAHSFYNHLGFQKIGEVPVKMGDWEFMDYLFSMSLSNKN